MRCIVGVLTSVGDPPLDRMRFVVHLRILNIQPTGIMNNELKFSRIGDGEWFAVSGKYHSTIRKRPNGKYVSHLYKDIASEPYRMFIASYVTDSLRKGAMWAMEQEYITHKKMSEAFSKI
jgi:hypothetical protein